MLGRIRLGWGWTVRLAARTCLRIDGCADRAGARLATAVGGHWTATPAACGGGAGTLVVGRGRPVLPAHQRTDGSLRHRAAQQAKRRRQLAGQHPKPGPDRTAMTDAWLLLVTTHADPWAAGRADRRRWAIAGSYRDAQGGWDGQHGWDLEPTVARLTSATEVAALTDPSGRLRPWLLETLQDGPRRLAQPASAPLPDTPALTTGLGTAA